MNDEEIAEVALAEAHRGDADAQCYIAIGLSYGWNGFERNEREALAWFRRAAEQGHREALYTLGSRHDVGDGVPQNPSEAQRLYALAAAQGHVEALTALVPMGTG